MADDVRTESIIGWKGLLAGRSARLRRLVTFVVALTCVTYILTQWGYKGVLLPDGQLSYLMPLFIPVAVGCLLLGPVAGIAFGVISGVTLFAHACIIPLDYYELVYVTPVNSVVAIPVSALMLSVLLALFLRKGLQGWRRILCIALACAVASCGFTAIAALESKYFVSTPPHVSWQPYSLETAAFQAASNTVIMLVTVLVCDVVHESVRRRTEVTDLRTVFSGRLLAVVLIGFMGVSIVAHGTVTVGQLSLANTNMMEGASYLLYQVQRCSAFNSKMLEMLVEADAFTPENKDDMDSLLSAGGLENLVTGYGEEGGLVFLKLENSILAANDPNIGSWNMPATEDAFDPSIVAADKRSVENEAIERVLYLAPADYSDFWSFVPKPTTDDSEPTLVYQVGYLISLQDSDYGVVMIWPSSKVFATRTIVVSWIVVLSLVLLCAMYVLARRLLERMVARRIDGTNAALSRITAGDLEARVELGGTYEFQELATGINQTVDTLKGWIAEAERSMDSELHAAEAIQASVLPRTFPAFPEISRFDLYASMEPAKKVGGDFYDFFLIDDCGPDAGRLAFVMADVSGKGVPAALFMMRAKALIKDSLQSGMELAEAVARANGQLNEGNKAMMFVTAWVGVLDYSSGRVDFVNAGHNPPLLLQGASYRWVKNLSGVPLGFMDGVEYISHSLELAPGDEILLYTDGVTEAFTEDNEEYGNDRLESLMAKSCGLHPQELVDRVRADVAEFTAGAKQSDDITILAMEYLG